jgi:tRNA threonylcarbamoyladenosine biosynthesis protein TsaB
MIILTIRTDNPEAEIGLYSDKKQLAYDMWHAHRDLSATIHAKLEELLKKQNKDWHDVQGIVCYQGPGSFTGLRIGLTVGNALAYTLKVPIVAEQNDWIERGIARLLGGESDPLALPHYGQDAHITLPKR